MFNIKNVAIVLDRKTGYGAVAGEYTGFKADIASATDYYPFGMEMEGRNLSSEKSRFGYNGQEKDNEVRGTGSSYAYEYRMYDPRTGRFLSIDPLAQKYPYYTPYQFAGNRVISCLDIEGLEDIYFMDKNIDEIQGEPMIDILKKISLFQAGYADFKNPDFNKGYNIIIIDGLPSEKTKDVKEAAKNVFVRGETEQRYDYASIQSWIQAPWVTPGFDKEFQESNAFKQTMAQKRGIVFVYIPKGIIPASKGWANNLNDVNVAAALKGGIATLAHEAIAHAFDRVKYGIATPENMIKEHLLYHEFDPKNPSSWPYNNGSSPDNTYIQNHLKKSKAAQVLKEIDTQIELLKTKKNKSK